MILVITLTMLIAYAITTLVVYRQTIHIMEGEVRQEADYINVALDTSGESYLKTMDNVHVDTRITLIDPDGKVKYDSKEDDVTLQNHKNRPEVKAALKNGSGQDIRESNTLNKEMFYYAVKLENGDILRVSKTVDTAFRTAMKVFPAMGLIALIMLAFAGILVKWQVTRLIRPINRLDLENPLENDVYEELTPLLQSIDKQNKEKDAVANMRKEFSANVSHELKTPIALIQGYAEGLKEGVNDDPESRDFYCDVIMDEAGKMNRMVKNLMTLNQLEFGNDKVEFERFNLTELIGGVLQSMDILSQQKDVKLIFREENPVYVWGDEFKIEQVVRNYVSNAYNHVNEEKIIEVKILQEDGLAKVTVFNTGKPIPEEDVPRIWDKFYKVDKAHTREYGGNGIGLSIVKAIMESMHQQYGVKNYDNGVEFWFTLDVR